MKLNVDVAPVRFLVAEEPRQVTDFQTKAPKVSPTGEPIYRVKLLAMSESGSDFLQVKFIHPPKGITPGAAVGVVGASVEVWARDGKSGVTFSAERIEPIASPARAAS